MKESGEGEEILYFFLFFENVMKQSKNDLWLFKKV
jgi:hypothetical protein